MSLAKVRPFAHGVEVGRTVGGGTVVEVGTRIMMDVGIISTGRVGGTKNVGVDWGVHADSVKMNNRIANSFESQKRRRDVRQLKRLADIQHRERSSGILVSRDPLQSRAAAMKHEHRACAYRLYNWFPKLF